MRTLPKAPERLYGEIGMLAFWVPSFWKKVEMQKNMYRKVVQNRSVSKEMG